ncbi:MAG: hypothetical protein LiPW15_491 [Parcubacteria group bacterium LiPW_15]|nr:MAG: hypothetical protein LiPW15_491 [Parcubacteria group bacterium LiPW_15]
MEASEKVFPEAEKPEEIAVEPGDIFGEGAEPAPEKESPIKPGEIFDPEDELRKTLKFSGKEKEERFAEYKEKYRYQREGLAEMEVALRDFIVENPDSPAEELISRANSFFIKYGFSVKERLKVFSIVSKYTERRGDVSAELREFMNGEAEPSINAEKLFDALFCAKPEGRVEVVQGPISILIRCFDELDYMRAIKVESLLTGLDQGKYLDMAVGSQAIKLNKTLRSRLDNAVTLENTELLEKRIRAKGLSPEESEAEAKKESKNNYLHEEQHAVFAMLKEEEIPRSTHLNEIVSADKEEERYVAARLYFKDYLPLLSAASKDEILARMSGEFSEKDFRSGMEELRRSFGKGGFYDFRATFGKYVADEVLGRVKPEERATVLRAQSEIFGEDYERKIKAAIDAVYELLGAGYGLGQARAMLQGVPLWKWAREVSHLVRKAA